MSASGGRSSSSSIQSPQNDYAKKILHELDQEVVARCNAATAHGTNSKPILRLYRTCTELQKQALVYECENDLPRAYMMFKTLCRFFLHIVTSHNSFQQKMFSKERIQFTKICNDALATIEKMHQQLTKQYEADFLEQERQTELEIMRQQDEEIAARTQAQKLAQEQEDLALAEALAKRLADLTPSPPPATVVPTAATADELSTTTATTASLVGSTVTSTPSSSLPEVPSQVVASIPYPSISPPSVAPTSSPQPQSSVPQYQSRPMIPPAQSMQPQRQQWSQPPQPQFQSQPQQFQQSPPQPRMMQPQQPQLQQPYQTQPSYQQPQLRPAAGMPSQPMQRYTQPQIQPQIPPSMPPFPMRSIPPPSAPDLPYTPSLPLPQVRAGAVNSIPAPPAPVKPAEKPRVRNTPVFSETLRPIHLPTNVMADFYSFAELNTNANVETCGILCGRFDEKTKDLWITHVIIPNQSATSDTCVTTDEEQLIALQIEHDLLTLGWIHTHPSQTCFLSSIDLHTHFSYQLMLNESIAIVLAPKHSPNSGVFHCTLAGMKALTSCARTGFHKHEEPFPLYSLAPHYHWESDPKHAAKFMDLRPRPTTRSNNATATIVLHSHNHPHHLHPHSHGGLYPHTGPH